MKGLGCVIEVIERRLEMLNKENLGPNNDCGVRGGCA